MSVSVSLLVSVLAWSTSRPGVLDDQASLLFVVCLAVGLRVLLSGLRACYVVSGFLARGGAVHFDVVCGIFRGLMNDFRYRWTGPIA